MTSIDERMADSIDRLQRKNATNRFASFNSEPGLS